MPSRRQRFFNAYARYVQKPALALITHNGLARATFTFNAITTYHRPKGLRVTPLPLDGVDGHVCSIGTPGTAGTLLYIHGGAFMIGSLRGYQHLIALLSEQANLRGVYVDYRLAPENPFPAALDDVETAYRALLADPASGPIFVAGDSAGGNLALALVQRLKRQGAPLPAGCLCFSPVTDLRLQNPSLAANQKSDHLVPMSWGQRGVVGYLAGHDATDPEVSPILGDFSAAPPTYISCDRTEVLYDDGRLMAEKLRADGVNVTLEEQSGLPHVWQLNCGRSPEADASVAAAARFLSGCLPSTDAAAG